MLGRLPTKLDINHKNVAATCDGVLVTVQEVQQVRRDKSAFFNFATKE